MPIDDPPTFLRPDVAATFRHSAVAASYRHRPHYPPQTFEVLAGLIRGNTRTVLDLGCGTGFVARPLAPLADRVDALDASSAMIAEGKRLPGGDHPHLNWIVGQAEDAELCPPYALVTAGDSLHWMDWSIVLPRVAGVLAPSGYLAILTVSGKPVTAAEGFETEELELIRRYTTFQDWRPFDLAETLEQRGLFRRDDRVDVAGTTFRQSVDEYVESFHARASLSWERMAPAAAAAFDADLGRLVRNRVGDPVELAVRASIVWGEPRNA